MTRSRKRPKPKYKTPFFFDRTVPKDLYYSIQRRLNMLGYGAVWQPRSAVRGKDRDPKDIADYCLNRGIKIIATFSKAFKLPKEYEDKVKVIKLKGGRRRTVNKIIARLFTELRSAQ